MKRPVSRVAPLVTVLGIVSACSGEGTVGKEQLATLCSEKAKGSLNCSCFTDALEASLTPEEFDRVAKAIDANRRYSGLVPNEIANNAALGMTVTEAQLNCAA